ncbi:dullard-like phosphatase domain containing protein [Nitzschia inconspicua]|uniref:Dullard-like phosphatase domain containing protein n=1 Tax=Nitzschia inconspicua TaxID=303405 RepID=A0A9K3KZZ8_9STRA|nr:dullard-like phosphatase domain containing protein [Nitzschia inconspicua]
MTKPASSTPSNSSATASGTTPIRTPARSNYAAPHTPIASAKRPRSSVDKSQMLVSPGGRLPTSAPLDEDNVVLDDHIPETPRASTNNTLDRTQLSPMHPARPMVIHEEPRKEDAATAGEDVEGDGSSWVGRKVDALFSPMLNLLSGKEDNDDGEEEEEDIDAIKPPASESTQTTSQETLDEEEEEEQPADEATARSEQRRQQKQDKEQDEVLVEDDHSSQASEGEEEEDEFNPYAFIKSLPSYELVAPLRPPISLPPKDDQAPPISLVLDLDETLVHCTVEPVDDADLVFPVVFHGMTYQVHVRLRPHLYEFLEKIAGKFEVIVFTASQKVYANELLNLIDPDGKYIQHRLFRESCLSVEGNFLKDLNVLGRDLSKAVLVDNSPHAFGYQVDNGIPIESWFDDPNDTELLKLERFLKSLHGADDVRTVVRKMFRTHQLIEQS